MYSRRYEGRTSDVRVTIRRNCLTSLNMGYTLHVSGSSPVQNPLSWWISDPVQSKSAWTGLDYESSGLIQSIPYSGRNIARCFNVSQIETHHRSPCDHLFERKMFEGQHFILMYAITGTTSGKWTPFSVLSSVLEDEKQYVRPGISWKCFPSCRRVPRQYQISLNWGIDGHLSGINPLPATSLGSC